MSRSAKITVWAIVGGALIVAFIITGGRRLHRESVESIDQIQERVGVPVDVVIARVVSVEDWREFTGVAQGIEQVDLMSDYRSRVTRVHAKVGQEVSKGSYIVSFDAFDPVRFATNYETLKTAYETARRDSIRTEELYRTGAVSEQDVERVRAATEAARSAYVMSGRAVHLDTPINGMVTATYVNAGDYADAGQIVATVAAFDRIRVTLNVSATERADIDVGMPVRIRLQNPTPHRRSCTPGSMEADSLPTDSADHETTLTGKVTKASLSADPDSRLFSIEAVVENRDRILKPGMLVSPEILVASSAALPAVPPAALFQRNGDQLLYVVTAQGDSMMATLRTATLAVKNGRLVAISSGVSAGERVVMAGQNRLENGTRVALHKDVSAEYFASVPAKG